MLTAAAAIDHSSELLAMVLDSGNSVAMRNPRQIATQNIDRERGSHEDSAYPKAPIKMHAPPVRTGTRFTALAAVSFSVVFASRHLFSISAEYSPRRAAWLQRAR